MAWSWHDQWSSNWRQGQDAGWFQQEQGWKTRVSQDKWTDRFANVSTLGMKHPLPLEDRRDLVLGLLEKLQDEVDVASASGNQEGQGGFKIAVAGWNQVLIHAILFYLCRAKPSMPIRTLRNDDCVFVVADAAEMLFVEFRSLFTSPEEKRQVYELISECRWGRTQHLMAAAVGVGFQPGDVEPKKEGRSDTVAVAGTGLAVVAVGASPSASGAGTGSQRVLARMSTDEELVSLKKRHEVLELRKSLVQAETALRTVTGGTTENSVRSPAQPHVDAEHEAAMAGALPAAAFRPVCLHAPVAPAPPQPKAAPVAPAPPQLVCLQAPAAPAATAAPVVTQPDMAEYAAAAPPPPKAAAPEATMAEYAHNSWRTALAKLDGKQAMAALSEAMESVAAKAMADMSNASGSGIVQPLQTQAVVSPSASGPVGTPVHSGPKASPIKSKISELLVTKRALEEKVAAQKAAKVAEAARLEEAEAARREEAEAGRRKEAEAAARQKEEAKAARQGEVETEVARQAVTEAREVEAEAAKAAQAKQESQMHALVAEVQALKQAQQASEVEAALREEQAQAAAAEAQAALHEQQAQAKENSEMQTLNAEVASLKQELSAADGRAKETKAVVCQQMSQAEALVAELQASELAAIETMQAQALAQAEARSSEQAEFDELTAHKNMPEHQMEEEEEEEADEEPEQSEKRARTS